MKPDGITPGGNRDAIAEVTEALGAVNLRGIASGDVFGVTDPTAAHEVSIGAPKGLVGGIDREGTGRDLDWAHPARDARDKFNSIEQRVALARRKAQMKIP